FLWNGTLCPNLTMRMGIATTHGRSFVFKNLNMIDERFTSKMASQSMHTAGATKKQKKQKGLVDKVSATIILQSYLSQQ
ncbi:MAG: RuvX/YqgF family protein, partial [Crocinitomicaceae bacterium]